MALLSEIDRAQGIRKAEQVQQQATEFITNTPGYCRAFSVFKYINAGYCKFGSTTGKSGKIVDSFN